MQALYNYQAAREYKKALSLDSLDLTVPKLSVIGITDAVEDDIATEASAAERVLAEKTIEKPLVEEAQPLSSDMDKDKITASLKQWADCLEPPRLGRLFQ